MLDAADTDTAGRAAMNWTDISARLQALQDATPRIQSMEQATLTVTERLERLRQNLHETAQEVTRQQEDISNRTPLEDDTIDHDRGLTD